MPDTNKPPPDDKLGLERLVFFSDAVMAIAITLLALNLRVPELDPARAAAQLPGQLAALAPSVMTFFISFLVIGIYWTSHHRYFGYIRRYDTRLILLNLLFLFFITCMPFLASLLGQYAFVPIALIAYSLAIAALGLSLALIWVYASHDHRLISDHVQPAEIRSIRVRLFAAPVVFLVAIPFAYVSPAVVIVIWWFSPLIVRLAMRLWGTRAPQDRPGRTPPAS